jgi:hypothetical protein
VMYQQQAPEGQGPEAPPQEGPPHASQESTNGHAEKKDDNAVDADFEVVDDSDTSGVKR